MVIVRKALERYITEFSEYSYRVDENDDLEAMTPVVNLIDKVYSKGVKLTKSEKEDVEDKIIRNGELPKWDLLIIPEGMVNS